MEIKQCGLCRRWKPVSDFYLNYGRVRPWCKICFSLSANSSPNRKAVRRRYHAKRRRDPGAKAAVWFFQTKNRDKRKHVAFDLSLDNVKNMFNSKCAYCGHAGVLEMSIDRINTQGGHTTDNVVPCCIVCQFIRRDMPLAAFRLLVPGIKQARERGLFGRWNGRPDKQLGTTYTAD